MLYHSTDWSVEIPDEWNIEDDETCTTFANPQGIGAFQISSYRKDDTVTDSDLHEFADDIALMEVSLPNVQGLEARFGKGEEFWRKWWLRSGQQMIFATYCRPSGERREEDDVVDSILNSLIATYDGKNS